MTGSASLYRQHLLPRPGNTIFGVITANLSFRSVWYTARDLYIHAQENSNYYSHVTLRVDVRGEHGHEEDDRFDGRPVTHLCYATVS